MKKNDFILFAACLLAGLALWGCFKITHHKPGSYATITIDGREYKTLPLSRDAEITVSSKNGGSNVLVIRNGQATITDANCPDKLCVRQPAIKHNGESLICLPHKMIVRIHGKTADNGTDAIAR